MEEKEFEKLWQKNKHLLLAEDKEWQELIANYKMKGVSSWLQYVIPAFIGIMCMNYMPVENEMLKWAIGTVVTLVCIAISHWLYGLFHSVKSSSDIEKRVKAEYRKSIASKKSTI
ncbi:MAG: hypothetical protein IJV27_02235 [Prevotella sp.]|nr:hypothetical protein [Prevotella sp.]